MTPRTRTTSATQRRIDNLRILIAELGAREMMTDEIAWLLKFSPSGARKYIRELLTDSVIEVARRVGGTADRLGLPVFRISVDRDLVAKYLVKLGMRKPSGKPALKLAPGRTLHIMADDTHYAVRASRVVPEHDALHAAFFPVAVRP